MARLYRCYAVAAGLQSDPIAHPVDRKGYLANVGEPGDRMTADELIAAIDRLTRLPAPWRTFRVEAFDD